MGNPDDFNPLKEAAQVLLQNAAKRYEEPLRQVQIRAETLAAQLATEKARAQAQIDHLETKLEHMEAELRVQRLRKEELEGQVRADQEIKSRFVDDRRQSEIAVHEFQQALRSQAAHQEALSRALEFSERRIKQLEAAILQYHRTCQTFLERDRMLRQSIESSKLQFQNYQKEILTYRNWVIRSQAEQKELQKKWMDAQKLADDRQVLLGETRMELETLRNEIEEKSILLEKNRLAAKEWEAAQFEEIETLKQKLESETKIREDFEARCRRAEEHVYVDRAKYEAIIGGLRDEISRLNLQVEMTQQVEQAKNEEVRQGLEEQRNSLQEAVEQLRMNLRVTLEERDNLDKEKQFLELEVNRLRLEYPVRDLLKTKEEEIDRVRRELEKEGLAGDRRSKLGDFLDLMVDQKSCLSQMLEEKRMAAEAIISAREAEASKKAERVITPPRFIPRSVPSC